MHHDGVVWYFQIATRTREPDIDEAGPNTHHRMYRCLSLQVACWTIFGIYFAELERVFLALGRD